MNAPSSPATTADSTSSTTSTPRARRRSTAKESKDGGGSATAPRVALLTGSTRGIGYACAKALCEVGYHSVISSRNPATVAAAVASLRRNGHSASGLSCHAEDPAGRKDLIRHALSYSPSISALIICAAASPARGPALAATGAPFAKMLALNVRAAAETVRDARQHLSERAVVVIIGSIAGYAPLPHLGLYSVSKAAAHALVRVLGNELAPSVRVVGVAPGLIRTAFSRPLWDNARAKRLIRFIPLQRLGEPADVARVVRFLCSDDAAYISGETIVVAGGMHSRL